MHCELRTCVVDGGDDDDIPQRDQADIQWSNVARKSKCQNKTARQAQSYGNHCALHAIDAVNGGGLQDLSWMERRINCSEYQLNFRINKDPGDKIKQDFTRQRSYSCNDPGWNRSFTFQEARNNDIFFLRNVGHSKCKGFLNIPVKWRSFNFHLLIRSAKLIPYTYLSFY